VDEIILSATATLSAPYRTKLASRLTELQKAVQEEELDGGGITVGSLRHFIELLQAYPAGCASDRTARGECGADGFAGKLAFSGWPGARGG
jgi:hypothetical protein